MHDPGSPWPLVHVVKRLPPFWDILSLYNCFFDESFAVAVRSEPISRYACPVCHGERGAIGRSRLPIARRKAGENLAIDPLAFAPITAARGVRPPVRASCFSARRGPRQGLIGAARSCNPGSSCAAIDTSFARGKVRVSLTRASASRVANVRFSSKPSESHLSLPDMEPLKP